jgi:NTP pyrophosphatase (non-canonical NTP hydrolase)
VNADEFKKVVSDALALHWVAKAVKSEITRANNAHGEFASAHEAYGVLVEEVAEFFDHVRAKESARDKKAMARELVQIAAVAQRYAAQLDPAMDEGPSE